MERLGPFEHDEVLKALPHRPPFLFVDRVTELVLFKSIVAERLLRPDEPQFAGHFPGQAIMPGVLVSESLAQTAGLILALSLRAAGDKDAEGKIFHLAAVNVKFLSPAVPGELLVIKAHCERDLGKLARFTAEAFVGKRLIASGNVTLAQVEDDQ
jgi:3-hydroxyacyl-[acyl-carrier-protein] dehydratase